MSYSSVRLISAGTPPVSLAEAKLNLRVDTDADDDVVQRCIESATSYVEAISSVSLSVSSYEIRYDRFPMGEFELPVGPLESLDSISYLDANHDVQTVPPAGYYADLESNPPRVVPLDSWPTAADLPGAVQVSATTAATGSVVLIQAVYLLLGHWYENREEVIVGTISGEIADRVPRI